MDLWNLVHPNEGNKSEKHNKTVGMDLSYKRIVEVSIDNINVVKEKHKLA